MEIKNKELKKKLSRLGLNDIRLIKGQGYFYIISDERTLKESSIYLNSFNHQSIDEWVNDIIQLVK